MKLRRWAAPAVLVSLLFVSGCGNDLTPGTASVVDGTRISKSEVTDVADAQCEGVALATKSGQQQQAVSRKVLVQQALSLLMDIELNYKYAATQGVTPKESSTEALYAQVAPLIAALPKASQPVLEHVFHRWAEGRDMITQIGEKATGQTVTASNEQTILDAGYKQREPWLKKVSIDTDPRYSPSKDGFPGAGDGSVSKATSTFAKGASASEPTAAFIGALPAGQKCG